MILRIERILKYLLVFLCLCLVKDLLPAIKEDERRLTGRDPVQLEYQMRESVRETGSLPSKYDGRELGRAPVVKNQEGLGTCWAIAASSALEASLRPEEELIFSADHISLMNGFNRAQDEGGDNLMTMSYLAGWKGPVLEEDDPYGDGITDETLKPVKHVQEIQVLDDLSVGQIKCAIYEYGTVQASIYMDLENAFSSSVYYNQLEYSYYYNGEEESNHDVCIIGWDDHFPASSFNVHTDKDGAFICQNSWGSGFGEEGIFYVSYEDTSIARHCVAYTRIEDTDNYDHMYQTDLCGWVGALGYGDGSCYFANIFTPLREEELQAVGFYATGENTSYEIYVMDGEKELEHVMLETEKAKGMFEHPGFYTVELEEPIRLYPEEKITVVILINTPDVQYPVATEYASDFGTENVIISDGDGYISHNGIVWIGTESKYHCNVCMKLYTRESSDPEGI